jgi:hypothetical protein
MRSFVWRALSRMPLDSPDELSMKYTTGTAL